MYLRQYTPAAPAVLPRQEVTTSALPPVQAVDLLGDPARRTTTEA
jgi:hypothetical protein